MYELSSAESGPLFLISSLNRSPNEICLNPNYFYMYVECVPFPEPGPPTTAIKFNLVLWFCLFVFCTIFFTSVCFLVYLVTDPPPYTLLFVGILADFTDYSPFCTIFCLCLFEFFLLSYFFDWYLVFDYWGTCLYWYLGLYYWNRVTEITMSQTISNKNLIILE